MLKKENNYDFRKRLLQIHKKDRRDWQAQAELDELVIKDGFKIVLPEEFGSIIYTAALDFIDYLFTSMNVSALITNKQDALSENCLQIIVDPNFGQNKEKYSYEVKISDVIQLISNNERGIARGLYYLEDIMNLRMAPYLKKMEIKRRNIFEMRATMSGYGIDLFPDAYLSRLAHEGITVIFLWIKDFNETLKGHLDFNELGYRAERYGIDLYVSSYAHHSVHPDDEDAQEFYDKMYGSLLARCPYIKGIKIVGEASQFSSRDPNVGKAPHTANYIDGIPTGKISPGWWPCTDWPDLLKTIQNAVYKVRPDVDIIFCSYNWGWAPEEDRVRLINNLPKGISLLVTWEMFEHYKLGDADEVCCDYTIRIPGPGSYFISEAKAATERGLTVYAISNTTGRTWDYGVIPYMPAPFQWQKRYESIRLANKKYNLRGLSEAHHYGVWPSFITELEKWAFLLPEENLDDILEKILISHFGKQNFTLVRKALQYWDEAFKNITPTNEDQYGAFRIGPSYPFWINGDTRPPQDKFAMFKAKGMYHGRYYASSDGTLCQIRVHEEIKSLEKALCLFNKGLEEFEEIKEHDRCLELEHLINMGYFIYRTTISGINQKRFYILLNQFHAGKDRKEIMYILDEIEQLLLSEKENALMTIPIVEKDSVLGWEPSMEYTTDKEHIEWKIRQVDYELNHTIPKLKKQCMQ